MRAFSFPFFELPWKYPGSVYLKIKVGLRCAVLEWPHQYFFSKGKKKRAHLKQYFSHCYWQRACNDHITYELLASKGHFYWSLFLFSHPPFLLLSRLNDIMLHEVPDSLQTVFRLCASMFLRYLYFQNKIVSNAGFRPAWTALDF